MYKTKLGMLANANFGESIERQLHLMAEAGFDSFFTSWDAHTADYRRIADELGLIYQSVHAPCRGAASMWAEGDAGKASTQQLIDCVEDCAANGVGIMIAHVWWGFNTEPGPTDTGLRSYGKVVDAAMKRGVKVAFENTEGPEYLDALLREFRGCEAVGYCWDTGHENCYTDGIDFLSLYGDQLIATHLNDNLGISDFHGSIAARDDIHLLPFDGTVDWENAMARLAKTGYDGILTFELKRQNQPGRHVNDKYLAMTPEMYFAEAQARACRLAAMRNRMLKK